MYAGACRRHNSLFSFSDELDLKKGRESEYKRRKKTRERKIETTTAAVVTRTFFSLSPDYRESQRIFGIHLLTFDEYHQSRKKFPRTFSMERKVSAFSKSLTTIRCENFIYLFFFYLLIFSFASCHGVNFNQSAVRFCVRSKSLLPLGSVFSGLHCV